MHVFKYVIFQLVNETVNIPLLIHEDVEPENLPNVDY